MQQNPERSCGCRCRYNCRGSNVESDKSRNSVLITLYVAPGSRGSDNRETKHGGLRGIPFRATEFKLVVDPGDLADPLVPRLLTMHRTVRTSRTSKPLLSIKGGRSPKCRAYPFEMYPSTITPRVTFSFGACPFPLPFHGCPSLLSGFYVYRKADGKNAGLRGENAPQRWQVRNRAQRERTNINGLRDLSS